MSASERIESSAGSSSTARYAEFFFIYNCTAMQMAKKEKERAAMQDETCPGADDLASG
jgi:hypothetical protein